MTKQKTRRAGKAQAKKSVRSSSKRGAASSGGADRAKLSGVAASFPSSVVSFLALIGFGYMFRVAPLVDLATAFLGRMKNYAAAFEAYGFGAQWIADIQKLCQELLDDAAALGGDTADTVPSGRTLHDIMGLAKQWRRVVRTILDITPGMYGLGVHVSSGHHVDKLEKSMRALIRYAADKRTVPFGGGAALAQQGRDLLAQLLTARGDHKTEVAQLSGAQRELQAKKGVLVEELKRLGRVARTACPADAHNFSVRAAIKSRQGKQPQGQPQAPSAKSA